MERKRAELMQRLRAMFDEPSVFADGRLPPERELAASLGVSRNLLREAMVSLEALGFLEIRERQGAFILRPSGEDFSASLKFVQLWPDDILVQLMEMRLMIEAPIAGLAALRRTEPELDKMKECLRMLESASGAADGGASSGAQWDSMLHKGIVDAAHNLLLSRLYEGLAMTMERHIVISRGRLLGLSDWPAKILAEHRELIEAIARRDAEAAVEAQKRHLESALEKLRTLSAGHG
ncbi:MAG TPA: FCD domain-containing protein [Rectinemataceae bacterium]|nr:FCD domain-containing protein [Rectinemataceae bacterium]